MGRLCIVSRDSPRLLGYLMVVLDKELRSPDAMELVIDRRQPGPPRSATAGPAGIERRRSAEIVDSALRARGYVLIGADGEIAPEGIGIPAGRARRGRPLPGFRRVTRFAPAIALVLVVAAAVFGFLSTTEDGRARIVSRIISWVPTLPTRTSVAEPTASVPAPVPAPAPQAGAAPPEPPATAQREPTVSTPSPAPLRRVPDVVSAPSPAPPLRRVPEAVSAPSRMEPVPTLPPATRSDSRATPSGPTASQREPAPKLPPPTASRRELPAPVPATAASRREAPAAPRDTSPAPPATAAARRETSASAASKRTAKSAGPPRVELDARPEGVEAERVIVYTVRLSDPTGRPLNDAAVSLHGWLPNGSDLTTSLYSTATPGTYTARVQVGQRTPTNLRVRVMHEGMRFEVPSGR